MTIQAVRLIGAGIPTDYRYVLRRGDGEIVRECCCYPPGGYIYSSKYAPGIGDRCHDESAIWLSGSPELDAWTLTVGVGYNCESDESRHGIPPHEGLRFSLAGWEMIGGLGTIYTAELYIRQVKPAYGPTECLVCGGAFTYGSDACGGSGMGSYVFTETQDETGSYQLVLNSTGYEFADRCATALGHPHVFEERIVLTVLI